MEFRNCVENRRSIRSFRPDPVRREDILYCLDAARLSPSSLNCSHGGSWYWTTPSSRTGPPAISAIPCSRAISMPGRLRY
ncbi:MAG: nitroreductase family protein [Acutalibacteraceae bacterium]